MPDARHVEEVIESIAHRSWELFKADPVLYVLGSALLCVLGIVSAGVLAAPLLVGLIRIVRRRLRGQEAQLGDIFGAMSTFVTGLVVFFVILACVAAGGIVFVLPGLVVLIIFGFSFHEIAYKDAGIVEALKGSYRVLANNAVLVILMVLSVAVLNTIAGVTLIGVLLTLPYSLIALTVCYEQITGLT